MKSCIILWIINFILIALCFVLKRKPRIIPVVILVLTVTIFALITPEGKVLFKIADFGITEGALFDGLFKSGVLVFLQYLSKLVISSKLKLPGLAGKFLTEVFAIYGCLMAEKIQNEKSDKSDKSAKSDNPDGKMRALIKSIDERLSAAWKMEAIVDV